MGRRGVLAAEDDASTQPQQLLHAERTAALLGREEIDGPIATHEARGATRRRLAATGPWRLDIGTLSYRRAGWPIST